MRHVIVLALCAVTGVVQTTARAAEPIPHEALYDLSVRNWKLPSEITRVVGSQLVRLERGCNEWTTVTAFRLQAETSAGDSIDYETDFGSSESFDGTRLRFRKTTKANGELIQTFLGTAARPAPGEAGVVNLTDPDPDPDALYLPGSAMFPVAAFIRTSTAWEQGQKTLNYVLFDGNDVETVRVFELLTGTVSAPMPLAEGDQEFLEGKAWRTSAGFYTYEDDNDEPLTTITQNVLPNGITLEMALDVGFADIVLNLRRVRALPEPSC